MGFKNHLMQYFLEAFKVFNFESYSGQILYSGKLHKFSILGRLHLYKKGHDKMFLSRLKFDSLIIIFNAFLLFLKNI